MIDARSDVVGSLLRPPELLAAREHGDQDALRAAEDAAVDEVLRRQAEAGVDVVTDGEMRRLSFQSQMVEAVDGFGEVPLDAYLWGDWHGDAVGDQTTERPPGLGVKACRQTSSVPDARCRSTSARPTPGFSPA